MKTSPTLLRLVKHLFEQTQKLKFEKGRKRIIVYVSNEFYSRMLEESYELKGEASNETMEFLTNRTVLGYPVFRTTPAECGAIPPDFHVTVS